MRLAQIPAPARPEDFLAWDEAFLEALEAGEIDETLWFWEATAPFVVVGYGQQIAREVNADLCRAAAIPILRRCSGGGTVVQGPGCLNYALVLRTTDSGHLASITSANAWIMDRQRRAMARLTGRPVEVRGHTDLTVEGRKFSGNAQRRRRQALLFHGSFLLNFDLASISRWLPMPSAQPDYRADRTHADFLTNLGVPTDAVKAALVNEWGALDSEDALPHARFREARQLRYDRPEWHAQR
jgi:lipoate---protein ligase